MPSVECFGKFYDNDYPISIGVESGYYIKARTNLNNPTWILIPADYLNDLVLMSNSQVFNISNSTLYCSVVISGTFYRGRWSARDTLEISAYNGQGSNIWTRCNILEILDMNFDFFAINPDNMYANNNLHFSKFEIAVISLLVAILFFGVMRWYLLHNH